MRRIDPAVSMDRKLVILVVMILAWNTLFMAGGFLYLKKSFIDTPEDFSLKLKMAKELVDYNRRLAKSLGVESRTPVREALARFNYEIDSAANSEDLIVAIIANGQRTQERILQEFEERQKEIVLSLVNQDDKIRMVDNKQRIKVTFARDGGLMVEPESILSEETLYKISAALTPTLGQWSHDFTVEMEVEEGRALLAVPYNPQEQIRALTREIDSLRVTLHELRSRAGFAEMMGPGIIVRIYDAEEGYTNDAIIHETDVRDTVNELFAAGAKGVAVGNQRIIATSAIRCVGPSILVNDERIAVNPVEIKAIGDPEVLASGLDILRITLELSRNLRFEIEKVDSLALPAYAR